MATFHTLIKRCKKPTATLSEWRASERACLCASVCNSFPPVFRDFHKSCGVQQINGVPEGSSCVVSGELLNDGMQLKFNNRHVCIHATHYNVWYHYFRVRHFPNYVCNNVYGTNGAELLAEKMWNKSTAVLRNYLAALYK